MSRVVSLSPRGGKQKPFLRSRTNDSCNIPAHRINPLVYLLFFFFFFATVTLPRTFDENIADLRTRSSERALRVDGVATDGWGAIFDYKWLGFELFFEFSNFHLALWDLTLLSFFPLLEARKKKSE